MCMLLKDVLTWLGWGLILLGGASGVVLFFRAAAGNAKEDVSTSTLWGLFIIGLVAGIGLLYYALS